MEKRMTLQKICRSLLAITILMASITSSSVAGMVNIGSLIAAGGNINVSIDVENMGMMEGTGPITSNITNHGTINPGRVPTTDIGTLTINGNLSLASSGKLNIDIRGISQYDQLVVSGNASLDGALEVVLAGSYVPTSGDSFTIMTYSGKTGAFSNIILPDSQWYIEYGATSITLIYDATPPNAPVVSGTALTNDTTPTWSWTSGGNGGNGTFRYQLDSVVGIWTETTTLTYTPSTAQSDGSHTLYVQERDIAGNWSASGTRTITIDATPPSAPVVTGTTPTNDTTPTWSWTSGGGGNGTYRYRRNNPDLTSGAVTTANTSFTPATALTQGTHTLYVQERDAAGNWTTSGSYSIVVDTTGPTTSITAKPTDPSNTASPSFSFTGSDAGSGVVSYECSLDSGTYTACTSPNTFLSLTSGSHTFSVRAKDNAGNVDATPATYAWAIDLIKPALGAVTPTPITTEQGKAQTFTAVYTASEGFDNLKILDFLVNATLSNANGIKLQYDQSTNLLKLYDNAGTSTQGACAPGAAGVTITNTQGTLNCQTTTVTKTGNNITVKWSITPASAFSSATAKKIYTKVTDKAANATAWVQKATWKVISTNTKPTLGTIIPTPATSSAGTAKLFTATYSDADGYENLKMVEILAIETTTGTANGIRSRYDMATNKLYLYNDAGTALIAGGGCTPGAVGKTIANTRGTLNCQTTTVTKAGNTVTAKWAITPKAAFATGINKYLKLKATDNSNAYIGFVNKGTWTITPASPAEAETEAELYSVIRYGVKNNEPYSYQEEEAMDSAEDILIGVTEQTEATTELTVAIRKAKAAAPDISGSYRVVEQTTGAAEYEYRFDGKGSVQIIKNAKVIETVSYSIDATGALTIGTLSGQIRADRSVFVLGSAEQTALIIGTRSSTSAPSGTYEGAEISNRSNAITISPKTETVNMQPDAPVTDDGDVVIRAYGNETEEETGFSIMKRR